MEENINIRKQKISCNRYNTQKTESTSSFGNTTCDRSPPQRREIASIPEMEISNFRIDGEIEGFGKFEGNKFERKGFLDLGENGFWFWEKRVAEI